MSLLMGSTTAYRPEGGNGLVGQPREYFEDFLNQLMFSVVSAYHLDVNRVLHTLYDRLFLQGCSFYARQIWTSANLPLNNVSYTSSNYDRAFPLLALPALRNLSPISNDVP